MVIKAPEVVAMLFVYHTYVVHGKILAGEILANHTGKSYWREKIWRLSLAATVSTYANTFSIICEYWQGKFWRIAHSLPNSTIFPCQNFPMYSIPYGTS